MLYLSHGTCTCEIVRTVQVQEQMFLVLRVVSSLWTHELESCVYHNGDVHTCTVGRNVGESITYIIYS